MRPNCTFEKFKLIVNTIHDPTNVYFMKYLHINSVCIVKGVGTEEQELQGVLMCWEPGQWRSPSGSSP